MSDSAEDPHVVLRRVQTDQGQGVPEVVLIVYRWPGLERTGQRLRARLSLFECDPEHPDEARRRLRLGTLDVVLTRVRASEVLHRHEAPHETPAAGRLEVAFRSASWHSHEVLGWEGTKARSVDPASYAAPSQAAFELLLPTGQRKKRFKRFSFWVPKLNEVGELGAPGRSLPPAYDLGFELEAKGTRVSVLGPDQALAHVPARDGLGNMLALPERFSDPARDRERNLDGHGFGHFLRPGQVRYEFVQSWLAEHPHLRLNEVHESYPQPDSSDIEKAFFVLHDVGNLAPGYKLPNSKGATEGAMFSRSSRGKFQSPGHHGWVNAEGSLVLCNDLNAYSRGTKFDCSGYGRLQDRKAPLSSAPYWGTCLHFETFPAVLTLPRVVKELARLQGEDPGADEVEAGLAWLEEQRDAVASKARSYYERHVFSRARTLLKEQGQPELLAALEERWARPGLFELGHLSWTQFAGKTYLLLWPDALLEGLADLYLYASARAGHLLTITTHLEMDRNLVYDRIVRDLEARGERGDQARIAAAIEDRSLTKNLHCDPRGLDVGRLYGLITARLRRLKDSGSGLSLPDDALYGVHPARTRDPLTHRARRNRANAKNTWPHQSSPLVPEGYSKRHVQRRILGA